MEVLIISKGTGRQIRLMNLNMDGQSQEDTFGQGLLQWGQVAQADESNHVTIQTLPPPLLYTCHNVKQVEKEGSWHNGGILIKAAGAHEGSGFGRESCSWRERKLPVFKFPSCFAFGQQFSSFHSKVFPIFSVFSLGFFSGLRQVNCGSKVRKSPVATSARILGYNYDLRRFLSISQTLGGG